MHLPRPATALGLTALGAVAVGVTLVLAGAATAPRLPAAVTTGPTPVASAPSATPDAARLAPVADTVHVVGRVKPVDDVLAFSWPGVAFEGRFRGGSVGVVIGGGAADYDVFVDDRRVATWVEPAPGTHWVEDLSRPYRERRIRVVKRNESPRTTSTFGGFVAGPGGEILPAPAARRIQLEFHGDSYTAGFGNESTTRTCTDDEVDRTTNADRTFAAMTARWLDADVQINAFSGRGMVRNHNGSDLGTSYRTYEDRALLALDGDRWERPWDWQPQVVVVGLGINDFSRPVADGEPWTPESLRAEFRSAYRGFVDDLRERYGPRTFVVLSAPEHAGEVRAAVEEIAAGYRTAGDDRVVAWTYGGLDLAGCHGHPSVADHERVAGQLIPLLSSLLRGDGHTWVVGSEPVRELPPGGGPAREVSPRTAAPAS